MKQKGFYFDMNSCIECKACQVACKDKNNLGKSISYRRVEDFEGGEFPNPWVYFLSMSCNHCEKPICVEVCPTGAHHKREEDGLVVIDREKCVGCRRCERNCPFGAPKYLGPEIKKMGKCNGCIDLPEGETPACVASCNMRVLEMDYINNLRKNHPRATWMKVLSKHKTKPNTLIDIKSCAKGRV